MALPSKIFFSLLLSAWMVCAACAGPREDVMGVARSLLGTTEKTGRNDGPVIEAILASTGNRKGDPYCAAFVYYCGKTAGYPKLYPRSAWSPDMVQSPTWTRANGGQEPRAADAFGIYFPRKGRVAHTGLIESASRSVFVTVEGNTSPEAAAGSAADRDGGGIWRKRRLRSQVHSVRSWAP
jgi:hypothetical protein